MTPIIQAGQQKGGQVVDGKTKLAAVFAFLPDRPVRPRPDPGVVDQYVQAARIRPDLSGKHSDFIQGGEIRKAQSHPLYCFPAGLFNYIIHLHHDPAGRNHHYMQLDCTYFLIANAFFFGHAKELFYSWIASKSHCGGDFYQMGSFLIKGAFIFN